MLEKMLQLCCNLEDVMGKRLSNEEKVLIYELHKKGVSDMGIADQVCMRFETETLDRSTIHRCRQRFPSLRKKLLVKKLPVTPLQQEAFERCQVGDHGWMVRGELFVDCYTPKCLLGGVYPTGELIEEAYGERTTTRTCWFCGFTTEPRDEWGQVWVVAA